MSRILTDGEVKALFRQLVQAAGGVEACAVELGMRGHQRIVVMQDVKKPDMPNLRQIMALEVVAQSPIVSGAMMRAIKGEADEVLAAAVVESVQASAEALGAVHAMEADGHRSEAEIRAVQKKTRQALQEAQHAADAAAALRAGPVH
jgi:hypothetical protein